MKAKLFLILLNCFFFVGMNDPEYNNEQYLNRAFENDTEVFVSPYLAFLFTSWKTRLSLSLQDVTIDVNRSTHSELFFKIKNNKQNNYAFSLAEYDNRLIIYKIRKIININTAGMEYYEKDLRSFLEMFAWQYEIDNENIFNDLIFQNIIKFNYKGKKNSQQALKEIYHDYPGFLPMEIDTVYEVRQYIVLKIIPHKQFYPIEISVNLKKFRTLYFENIFSPIINLKDSINHWIDHKFNYLNKLNRNWTSSGNDVDTMDDISNVLIEDYFKGYNQNSVIKDNYLITEFSLNPFFKKFISPTLTYKITYNDKKTIPVYEVKFIKNQENEYFYRHFETENDSLNFPTDIVQQNLYFYSTVNLPKYLRNDGRTTQVPEIVFILHNNKGDTLRNLDMYSLNVILYKLSSKHLVYYFINKCSFDEEKLFLEGYSIYEDRKLYLLHFLKIREMYSKENFFFHLAKIIIELYPFIRIDNVKSLYD